MLRRLHPDQPESFEFTPANLEWAKQQIAKYPEGRQASAVIPLLWRAQEQEGWVSKPAIEYIAKMLDMAAIRVLEVATFYFMFQLRPVGSVAHVQVCGTTSCMLCGAEDLIEVCKRVIGPEPHVPSKDGRLSWEEVECLGACSNAPMAQIGKDYYEDLTPERFKEILKAFARGEVPRPGPQNGRFASEPAGGLTSLTRTERAHEANGSVALALALGDTVKRITGDEPPPPRPEAPRKAGAEAPGGVTEERAADEPAHAPSGRLAAPRDGRGDDLTLIKGVGPALRKKLNELGFWHFDQIAAWGPGEIEWVSRELGSAGRKVIGENFVEQARALSEADSTAYAQRKLDSD
jgi:NADH-quinone oxidoreductase subunit E